MAALESFLSTNDEAHWGNYTHNYIMGKIVTPIQMWYVGILKLFFHILQVWLVIPVHQFDMMLSSKEINTLLYLKKSSKLLLVHCWIMNIWMRLVKLSRWQGMMNSKLIVRPSLVYTCSCWVVLINFSTELWNHSFSQTALTYLPHSGLTQLRMYLAEPPIMA